MSPLDYVISFGLDVVGTLMLGLFSGLTTLIFDSFITPLFNALVGAFLPTA